MYTPKAPIPARPGRQGDRDGQREEDFHIAGQIGAFHSFEKIRETNPTVQNKRMAKARLEQEVWRALAS
jgi:hypothetical protein